MRIISVCIILFKAFLLCGEKQGCRMIAVTPWFDRASGWSWPKAGNIEGALSPKGAAMTEREEI